MAKIVVTQDNQTVVVGDNDTVVIDIPGGGTVNIVADPNDNVDKIKIDYGNSADASVVNVDLSTFSEDDLRIEIKNYDTDDKIGLQGAFDTYVDPGKVDEYRFDYVGADGNTYSSYVKALDGGEKDFTDPTNPIIICFAEGTIIETDLGPRPVESLLAGDLIQTHDNDLQPVLWIGRKRLDTLDLMLAPHLYPIRVSQGALGYGLPWKDLVLSPQHRMLLSDWRMELLFGDRDALAAIKHFEGCDGVAQDPTVSSVTYYHLLFEKHEIVSANGVLCESLHTGEMALEGADASLFRDVLDADPNLSRRMLGRSTARMVLKRHEAEAAVAIGARPASGTPADLATSDPQPLCLEA